MHRLSPYVIEQLLFLCAISAGGNVTTDIARSFSFVYRNPLHSRAPFKFQKAQACMYPSDFHTSHKKGLASLAPILL